jgi:hypothetical protein
MSPGIIPEPLQKLLRIKESSEKDSHASQQVLMEKANTVRTFQESGFSLRLRKLPIAQAMRMIARIPDPSLMCETCKGAKLLNEKKCETCKGEGVTLRELTVEEEALTIECYCEALSAASVDGFTPEQIGRMSPPEFPLDWIGKAFVFLLKMNQLTQKQLDSLEFFRINEGRLQSRPSMP